MAAASQRSIAVYPRVCGGTGVGEEDIMAAAGLSPRVRRNRRVAGVAGTGGGSIPACAGEPSARSVVLSIVWVYPRVCGGTEVEPSEDFEMRGLSPRVRGNLGCRAGVGDGDGSIPACAGEPLRSARLTTSNPVYPRVCGGTPPNRCLSRRKIGLSPRVRGNLIYGVKGRSGWGSIPACAGEPIPGLKTMADLRVYPRVCGGTAWHGSGNVRIEGLSPRVRGNLVSGSVRLR